MLRELRRISEVRRCTIRATDGNIGSLEELYFDDSTWAVWYLVVNTGTWLMGRGVLITPVAIVGFDESGLLLHVKLTREQVQNSPPVDAEKPISRQYETEYYTYFGWTPYWATGLSPGLQILPPQIAPDRMRELATEESEHEESHLRSTAEVSGYHIGHVVAKSAMWRTLSSTTRIGW